MTDIMQSLIKLFIILPAQGFNIDRAYIANILGLRLGLAAHVMQGTVVLEVLIEKTRWQKEGHPKTGPETGSSSGGNDGGNSTDTGGAQKQFYFDADIEQALKDALANWNLDTLLNLLKQCGWTLEREALDKVPEHLRVVGRFARSTFSPTNPRGGIRFEGKGNLEGEGVRIMQGNPTSQFPSQHPDYVKIISGGRVLGRDGKVISEKEHPSPGYHEDAHIPLNEWMQWQQWNKK